MVITKKEFNRKKKEFLKKIKKGEIFIYPTDTIYGIGCNALNSRAVRKIRKIKQRKKTPFSVIAPSKGWIRKNCTVSKEAEKWVNKLPGKYTLILKKKKKLPDEIAPNLKTIGIRIPKHWFSKEIKRLNIPIITTSVNVSGKRFMTSLKDLNKNIKNKVNFIIYEGKKTAKPSKIINLIRKTESIKR